MVRSWFPRRKTNTKNKFNIRFFQLDTLRIATNNFSTYIGRGGFGSVFKGVLPDDGRTVAVKTILKPYDGFLEMVEFVSHLRHINLIQVIGCCVENGEQILVYEFAENGSIPDRLYSETWPPFDWKTRAAICMGTARGLSYLHEDIYPGIIHRDIKPSNILLDANFVPKIADYDLLYCVNGDLSRGSESSNADDHSTYTATIKGTIGYMDPNYLMSGKFTEKVDVYSFGLTVLEMVTGRRAVELTRAEEGDHTFLNWVTRVRKEGSVLKIVDPKLTDFPKEDVERFIHVALLCTRATSTLRPTMFEVVHMLYGRHKSDHEISEMALGAIQEQPAQWSTAGSHDPASMSSTAFSITGDSHSSPENAPHERSKGECSSSKAEVAPAAERTLASTSKEEQSCPEGVVREYFERSMEKIKSFHVAMPTANNRRTIMNQTMVVSASSSQNVFMEAVYPPFLSGEYRTSRVRRSAPL